MKNKRKVGRPKIYNDALSEQLKIVVTPEQRKKLSTYAASTNQTMGEFLRSKIDELDFSLKGGASEKG